MTKIKKVAQKALTDLNFNINYEFQRKKMWIRSQDKTQLVKCTSFSLARNWGGKQKSAIVGTVSNASWWRKEVVIGLYDTKELALNELTNVQTELVNNTYIYEMN